MIGAMMAAMLQMAMPGSGVVSAPTKPYRILVPIGNQRTWFQPDDYPPLAIAQKASGIVRFAVQIGPDGKPTACRITRSSGSAALDAATCKALMARAQFHPLIDKKGKPTTLTFEQQVRWRLPARTTQELSDGTFDAHATINPQGEIVGCTMTGSGSARFGQAGNTCGPFGERGFLQSLMGADYPKARDSHVRLQVSYEGLPPKVNGRTPDFYLLLAEAEISVNPDGTMGKCTSVRPLEMQGRSVDLCTIVAMAPPRFETGTKAKRAVYVLDLSVSYR